MHDFDDELSYVDDESYRVPRNRTGSVIVVLTVLLGLGVIGWAAEKKYHVSARVMRAVASVTTQGPPPIDARLEPWLGDGEAALAAGDLDRAQTVFDKAAVLAERDPRVLVGQARVSNAKADVAWLRIRLLAPAEATEESKLARARANWDLQEKAQIARRAAEDAANAKPDDPRVIRARLDAARIAGDLGAARSFVVAVFGQASEPETAYVLAALDMAQPTPLWPTVVDRLRAAVLAENGAGRAHAALVYALGSSGGAAAARDELSKLDAMPRPHPLSPELHGVLTRQGFSPIAGGVLPAGGMAPGLPVGAPAPMGSVTGATAPMGMVPSAQTPAVAAGATPVAAVPATGAPEVNSRGALQAALDAIASRDFDRAERIYQGILSANPGDSQAIAGLGDVARLRGDYSTALSEYKRAIAHNPSYLPALLGEADTMWSKGDRSGAARVYSDIANRFPDGTYPPYVKQRAGNSPEAQ